MPNAGKKRGRRRRGKRVVRNEHEDPVSRIESQLALLPMAERSPELTAKAVKVIRGWHERLDPPSWRRVRKRVAKELNECGPALEWLQAEIPRLSRCHGGARVTIVDLCSGFGIFSMFASELLPPECLDRVRLWDVVESAYILGSTMDYKVIYWPERATINAFVGLHVSGNKDSSRRPFFSVQGTAICIDWLPTLA